MGFGRIRFGSICNAVLVDTSGDPLGNSEDRMTSQSPTKLGRWVWAFSPHVNKSLDVDCPGTRVCPWTSWLSSFKTVPERVDSGPPAALPISR